MPKLLTNLFLFLAHATHKELMAQIQYLQTENKILRSKLPRQVPLTPAEKKRLIRFGCKLGAALKHLITIVSYRTFTRWLAEGKKKTPKSQRGRPRTLAEIRKLILRLARENTWGYTRLLGELHKLGILGIGRTTIQNLLKAEGLDPSPERQRGTWDQFVKRHAQTLWACDFVSKKVWTLTGQFDCYLLVFIHIETRRVWVAPATFHPDATWVAQQARNFAMHLQDTGMQIMHLLRDRDAKFTQQFDAIIKTAGDISGTTSGNTSGGGGAKICKLPVRSPNLNAYAERWIQSLQTEALDHFIVFGEAHLNHVVSEYVNFYNTHRPHQSKNNLPLGYSKPEPAPVGGKIVCHQRLGGLLKHYHRQAA